MIQKQVAKTTEDKNDTSTLIWRESYLSSLCEFSMVCDFILSNVTIDFLFGVYFSYYFLIRAISSEKWQNILNEFSLNMNI